METLPLAKNEPDAVPTVSLDSLVGGGFIDATLPVVIKLDVEGVEVEALTGAERLMVICGEHGSDRTHGISRHMINEMSLNLFVFDPEMCRFIRLDDVGRLDRIKIYAWVGCNVFATSSAFWEDRLLAATWRYPMISLGLHVQVRLLPRIFAAMNLHARCGVEQPIRSTFSGWPSLSFPDLPPFFARVSRCHQKAERLALCRNRRREFS